MKPFLRGGLACLLAVPAIALPADASYADPAGPPDGRTCSFSATYGIEDPERRIGHIDGGPLAAPGHDISVRCSIQLGQANRTHAGAAQIVATAGPSRDVVYLPARLVTVHDDGSGIFFCTQATVGTTTWYWDGAAWTTDANAPCVEPVTCEFWNLIPDCTDDLLPPESHPVLNIVVCVLWRDWCQKDAWYYLDPITCPYLGGLAPGVPGIADVEPEGDAYVVGHGYWDCPPYGV